MTSVEVLVSLYVVEPSGSKFQNETSHKPFDLRVPGRIVLDVWKFMRNEVDPIFTYCYSVLCSDLHCVYIFR